VRFFIAGDFDSADMEAFRDLLACCWAGGINVSWSDLCEAALPEPGD
jgi:hypothetical protein